jgi:hypothetical protein
MSLDDLKEIVIDELLDSPAGEWIGKAMDTVTSVQRVLFAVFESEDSNQFTLLKIGTVFQIFLIDTLAGGKSPKDLEESDWKSIADKVAEYAILEDGQCYSEFVFTRYADYIELSAKALRRWKVSEENTESVQAIADEIRCKTEQLRNNEISEVDYVDQCLWLSLEAMIKCLSLSLTSLAGPEFTQLAQAITHLAFEYGRYRLYAKEQAILQQYLDNQRILDDQLRVEYNAYLEEVKRNAEQFQSLIDAAFSPDLRESLMESVALGKAAGVKEEELLKSVEEIDDFFLD